MIDLVILIVAAIYVALTFSKGFVRLSLELGVLLVSLLAALFSYAYLGSQLQQPLHVSQGYGKAIAFVSIWVLIELILSIALRWLIIPLIPSSLHHSPLNRVLGVIPATAKAILVLAFMASVFTNLPLPSSVRSAVLGSPTMSYLSHQTSRFTNAVFGSAISDTLQLLTVEPKSGKFIKLGYTVQDGKVDTQAEQRMLDLVNQERSSRGIKPLILSTDLQKVARAHSQDMFKRGYFAHTDPDGHSPFDRLKAAGISYQTAGENLALAPDVDVAHKGLMNSPGHRANILDPSFGHVGIGVIDGGFRGEMFAQEFTD